MRLVWFLAGALILSMGYSPTAAHQDAPLKVKLQRVYKAGESQDYTFVIEFDEGESVKLEGAFNLTIQKLADGGSAEIVEKVTKLKVTFGGESLDEQELPEPETLTYGPNGLPTELTDEYDLMSVLSYLGGWLPNTEVELGGTYEFKWIPGRTSIRAEGKATLIATGRLFEERVAKIEMEISCAGDADMGSSKTALTSYLNLETGKIVRIVGTSDLSAGGETATIKFDFKKVRS